MPAAIGARIASITCEQCRTAEAEAATLSGSILCRACAQVGNHQALPNDACAKCRSREPAFTRLPSGIQMCRPCTVEIVEGAQAIGDRTDIEN